MLMMWREDAREQDQEVHEMPEVAVLPALVAEKLAAIDRLEPAFVASFQYVQDVQGQKRFAQFPISSTVEYLHALAVCDAKDRLLGV
ncbi:MAG TPA: hypothetical protein VKC57_07290, partial [Ktedonobacterales bacterium]|nr:hypothetical protein [Ktedonobacterales bacterium]